MDKHRYLSLFPPTFLEDLVNSRCLPIIGAGFSKNATTINGNKLPDWEELGKKIAAFIPDYTYSNALDALSAFEHEYSRTNLIEKITDILAIDTVKPGETHKAFCELPFETVVTTNFEFLLEQGYQSVGKYCRPIIEENNLAIYTKKQGVTLLKLHGDINHPDRLIVVENDYDNFLTRYPMISTYLSNLLILKTPLFIGYSLDDADFRQICQIIYSRLGKLKRQAYTIAVDCSTHEMARFERRGIKVINIPGRRANYQTILTSVFQEMAEYWKKELLKYTTIKTDDILAELSMPPESNNRICFFSVPLKLLTFYKKYFFPIVKSHGFVPSTAEDIVVEGDNWMASVLAIIDRAELLVVDLASENTQYELYYALTKKKTRIKIFAVTDDFNKVNKELLNMLIIKRQSDPFDDPESLTNQFDKWIAELSVNYRTTLEEEPKRLLSKREYRAAVISAMSLLENYFSENIQWKMKINNLKRPYSIIEQLNQASNMEIIDNREYNSIKEWNKIRNNIVHDNKNVSFEQANRIVESIYSILNKLEEAHNT